GSLEMGAGDYAAAIDHFKVAASDEASGDSLRARAYFNIGKLNALQSRFSEAVQSYKKVFTLLPASPTGSRALLEAGRSALEAGMKKSNKEDANEALQYATRILSSPVSPYSGGAMILAARAGGYLRRYTDAASYFQQFIDEYPDDPFTPDMMFRLGKLCKDDLKNYRKALSVYDLIVQRYPQSPFALDAMLEIGECQEMTGDYAGALSTYNDVQTFFSAHSAYDTVRNKIEFIRNFKIKNTDDALENLARLLGEGFTKTSKGNLSFALGLIFFNDLKNYVSAEQEFANAIENGVEAERLPEALFLRARASHFQSVIDPGLVPKAVSYYEVFLNQYPSGNHSEEAAYYTYLLRRDSSGRQAAMLKEFLSKYPTSKHADELALLLAKTLWSANDYAGANSLYNSLRVSPEISLQFSEAMLQRGLTYLKLGLNDSALSSWRRAIAVPVPNRSSVQAMWELADVHWKRNDISEAVMLWKGITSDFPYTSYAEQSKHRLGEGYLAAKEYDEAISLYERRFSAMEKDPVQEISDYSDAFGLANAYERKGELQKSIAYYNQYLLNNRKGQYAGTCFYSLGRIAKARGNAALPASYFKQASASGSTEATANDIPDLLFQTEQYAEAAKQYRLLAGQTVDADRKKYYQSRAVISLLRTGKLSDAQAVISDFEKTFGKDKPALAEFEYEKAGVYYRKQDFTTAAKLYEKVADDFEDTRFGPFGQYYAGKILEATNKLAEAAKKYESIINHYPGSEVLPRVFLSLGNMHFNAERYEEAIRYYQRVTNDPSGDSTILPYAMNNLIKAYESTKLYDDAIKMTRDFIERFPNEESIPDKKIKLGTLYTRVGYYDQAVLHFQNLLNDAGSDVEAEIRYNIGEAYYDKGDYQQSLLEFLKVPYLVSKQGKVNWTATSLYMAGQAYERMSKFDEAIGMYQQIIDRPGIDATFKAGARKEIDRVKTLTKKGSQ
ncbi:MAG TPA: tetratricopeptide repeat protein, partial [Bacteroidota bacterium]|nr:tetratricopeptide repeat protein [Bacteroidota bacterium]